MRGIVAVYALLAFIIFAEEYSILTEKQMTPVLEDNHAWRKHATTNHWFSAFLSQILKDLWIIEVDFEAKVEIFHGKRSLLQT